MTEKSKYDSYLLMIARGYKWAKVLQIRDTDRMREDAANIRSEADSMEEFAKKHPAYRDNEHYKGIIAGMRKAAAMIDPDVNVFEPYL